MNGIENRTALVIKKKSTLEALKQLWLCKRDFHVEAMGALK